MKAIADRPPAEMYATGLEIDCQCARCGSSVDTERCGQCSDGFEYDHYDGDTDQSLCVACGGDYVWHRCMSSAGWCEANPLPGRESVQRGVVEWFTAAP